MSSNNVSASIKIDNRKAAHSQRPSTLKTKRKGAGKGGWGDPMDDLKFLNQDPSKNPNDPNFEAQIDESNQMEAQISTETLPQIDDADYFQNFESDVESLAAFKVKVEELVNNYLFDQDEDTFTMSLNALDCPNFFNQVPKVLLWTVISSKKQEHFPTTRKLLMHLRSTKTVSKIQLESAFRRLFHRLNELTIMNGNAYIILVDFGEYCVERNLMDSDFLHQLKKQTEFAKDPQRIVRLKKHITDIVAEFFSSGDVEEAVRCISEMDTPFYNHEVVKRMISIAFDHQNRERELTSQFLARAVGDNNVLDYPIPRKNCELGFIILLQRVEGLYKDVPDVLELLSSFIGRAIVDEVLAPSFLNHVETLETDMGYAVINHVKHLIAGQKAKVDDLLLNVWGINSSKSIASMKNAIKVIIREYLISRELDEALTAIQELNISMFHHEIIKQLIPLVADYYVAKDLIIGNDNNKLSEKEMKRLKIPNELSDKAVQIQLAIDLISTALEHNIMAIEQVRGGFKRLRDRMDDYKLDCPQIDKYYECIAANFENILKNEDMEQGIDEEKEYVKVPKYGGAKERVIDDEIKRVIEESKALVMAFVKDKASKIKKYEGIECKTQTVAGINYFVKICVDESKYIHVFLWKKLDQSMHVLDVEFDKTLECKLVFGGKDKEKNDEPKQQKRMMCGGLSERKIDNLVIDTCKKIAQHVTLRAKNDGVDGLKWSEFVPVKAKSQVVAGTNLFIKVRVNPNQFVHIRVWCKLDSTLELSNVEWNKAESDELVYF